MALPSSSAVIVDLIESPDDRLRLNITAPAFYTPHELLDIAFAIAGPYARRLLARELRSPLRPGPVSTLSDGRIEHHLTEAAG